MPGTGYNCDRPLLYWSAQALVEAGWRVDRINVRNASDDLSTVIPVLNQAIDGWVESVRGNQSGEYSNDNVGRDDADSSDSTNQSGRVCCSSANR